MKNDNSQKYLYIQYEQFYLPDYIEIESTRFSRGIYNLIIVAIIVIPIVLLIIMIIAIIKCKRRKKDNSNNGYTNITQNKDQYENEDSDFSDSNYPHQQQQPNIYYQPEPPQQTVN